MLNTALANKLRVSGPLPSDREIEETRVAMQEGRDLMEREGYRNPTMKALIWRLMQDAAETLHRLPDIEQTWLTSHQRAAWPSIAMPSEECRRIEWEIAMEIILGLRDKRDNDTKVRFSVTDPAAPRRMLTVLGWLRHVKARTHARLKRDQHVFLAMAQGLPWQVIRPMMGRNVTDFALMAVRNKVLRQVERGITTACKL